LPDGELVRDSDRVKKGYIDVGDEVGEQEDGRLVGLPVVVVVGPLVRKTVGYDEGVKRGREDGKIVVDLMVGNLVGWGVGDDEGLNIVGKEDGLAVVGLLVGSIVGTFDGSDVGTFDGSDVGTCEGSDVGAEIGD